MKKLPPLKALRAFEAAARHLSLTQAAEELFVSPGAISQQIKLLEEFLEVQLFERLHRQIRLTEAGDRLMPGVTAGFNQIQIAVDNTSAYSSNRPLTVSAAPSFAARWLVARLQRFQKKHPDIDVRLDTSTVLTDLAHSDIDIGIRFGAGNYPGLHVDFLSNVDVFPVCAPGLIRPDRPLTNPSGLRHYQLLHYEAGSELSSWPDWQMWLAASGTEGVDHVHGLRFVDVNLLLEAATQGQGVALAGSITVRDALRSGQLIKPFDLQIPLDFSYYFATPESRLNETRIRAFREWILEEMAAESVA